MGKKASTSALPISALLFLAAFAGCADFSTDGSGDGEGDVSFYVKDAPADELRSVFVTFDQVTVHRAGGGDDDGLQSVPDDDLSTVDDASITTVPDSSLTTVPSDDIDANDASWVTIVDTTKTIDLKQFQGDARAFLGESSVQAGKYTQIRIYVTDAYGENQTGARVNVTLSSGVLKIVRPWTIEDGETTTLVVDFDLGKSLSSHGKDGYRLKPVLKLTVENGGSDKSDASDSATDATSTETSDAGRGRDENKTKPSNSHKP